jgi:hypothetical protein
MNEKHTMRGIDVREVTALLRAREGPPQPLPVAHRRVRTQLIVTLAAVCALAASTALAATAATRGWWVFDTARPRAPQSEEVTIQTVDRGGHPWMLKAYVSTDGGVCFGFAPEQSSRVGAMECGGSASDHYLRSFLTSTQPPLPTWIAGLTSPLVSKVDVELSNGKALTADTIAAPSELHLASRFYLLELPSALVEVDALVARSAAGDELDRLKLNPTRDR